jgi:calcineurin-like phosphoesterase family protein
MSTTWFTADQHFGDTSVIQQYQRPFLNEQEMSETLVRNWNNLVQPEDTVYVLGDLARGDIERSLAHASRLTGTKLLVPGNHDLCWIGHRGITSSDVIMYLDAGFIILPCITFVPLSSSSVQRLMCHFPAVVDQEDQEDEFKDFRPSWPLEDPNDWLLHGHVHTAWRSHPSQNMVNVGVDVWDYKPVTLARIAELIRNRTQKRLANQKWSGR